MKTIDVLFALEKDVIPIRIPFENGLTVAQLIDTARSQLPDFDATKRLYSSYGRRIETEDLVTEGMRIEILRPLHITPTEARRLRAQRGDANRERRRFAKATQ